MTGSIDPAKRGRHRINLQALTDPYERLYWISEALPGSAHDVTATRRHDVLNVIARAGRA
jgi:hypothetical protein